MDSTFIKFRADGEWLIRKHGASRRRQWRKMHLAMDAGTGDVRAVEFTSSRQSDSPLLRELLSQIPPDELSIPSPPKVPMTRNGVIERGGPCDQTHPSKRTRLEGRLSRDHCAERNSACNRARGPGAPEEMGAIPCSQQGRGQDELPAALGERILSRAPERRTVETDIRIALMNTFRALGRAEIEAVA